MLNANKGTKILKPTEAANPIPNKILKMVSVMLYFFATYTNILTNFISKMQRGFFPFLLGIFPHFEHSTFIGHFDDLLLVL